MTKYELLKILGDIEVSYPFFKNSETLENDWFRIMHTFSYDDVRKNLDIAMADIRFQTNPPSAQYLVQGLTSESSKVNFNNRIVYCRICQKALSINEEQKHIERCSSIRYLVKQYKKLGKDLDKRTLWEMGQEEFDKKYDEFLHYVHEHTTNENERTRIGFIFDPPKKEIAKAFLAGENIKA